MYGSSVSKGTVSEDTGPLKVFPSIKNKKTDEWRML